MMKRLLKHHTYSHHLLLALVCLLAANMHASAQQEETIKVETELVNLNVVVKDRGGRSVSGLKKEDFEVYEDGVRQEISHFSADEKPLRLVLLFDTSVSMEEVLPIIQQEAIRLIDDLRLQDQVSVVTFATDVRRLTNWLNKDQAREQVKSLRLEPHQTPLPATISRQGYNVGDGNTYMYEALQYVFENVREGDNKVAVMMFSDGVDTGAGRSMERIKERADTVGKDVKWLAEESQSLVYPIRFKTKQWIGDAPRPAWRPLKTLKIGTTPTNPSVELLAKIADATGGDVFEFSTRQDLTVALQKTLTDLRSQYGLAYRPPQAKERAAFHRIKVRVKQPGLIARARDGYRRSK
jgi:Ca-activated chloride channel family protein